MAKYYPYILSRTDDAIRKSVTYAWQVGKNFLIEYSLLLVMGEVLHIEIGQGDYTNLNDFYTKEHRYLDNTFVFRLPKEWRASAYVDYLDHLAFYDSRVKIYRLKPGPKVALFLDFNNTVRKLIVELTRKPAA